MRFLIVKRKKIECKVYQHNILECCFFYNTLICLYFIIRLSQNTREIQSNKFTLRFATIPSLSFIILLQKD